ncbi:type III-B CRISPR module-associated protein Cmr5 [Parageobacillus thermoglucosidasius]|uniref:type III-B CRISPR module-associated protein Cmr5 n=1 Tax=Parageobacillus thermoglucosidasius TaxID=1426 RepID=UPI000B557E09|nr:type III-B CRISPR module-associated protein Cmr5 [Parageobacillus thermoglucosidasius]MBY6269760.1 type III-B CRISPR module-associated protein Cmr5 [Parageobacillus thermoglucosidasius]MED4905585.1 type III-B CRISPR module-associated protein Cmr5 [Parageobacillus thermoglucosidasius]MED4913971.1 type III-B CRISPR module-associated protein Cmr5 [Parageobacillus thermoglucosidasius]MED4945794.1 type III-B CRISPR module-associated protein Cmr5 [Parageobacillus thermoglucosidasius]MED4981277.1 
MSEVKRIEQERAEFAYQCAVKGIEIKQLTNWKGDYYCDEHYVSYVRKIPALIKTNGLGATFAYILSKRKKKREKDNKKIMPGHKDNPKNAYDLIYEQTKEWLEKNPIYPLQLKGQELAWTLISLDSKDYRRITLEVLSFFQWLRRFAEGVRVDEKTEKS